LLAWLGPRALRDKPLATQSVIANPVEPAVEPRIEKRRP